MKKIIFDMDGTIANFYEVPDWLESLRKEDASPYRKAEPLVNVTEFNVLCGILRRKGYEIGIVSWLSKESSQSFKREVRKAKREWLERYFPSCGKEIHLIQYGTPKYRVTNPKGAILFDDEERNGRAWERAGGIWYNPATTKIENILKELAGL